MKVNAEDIYGKYAGHCESTGPQKKAPEHLLLGLSALMPEGPEHSLLTVRDEGTKTQWSGCWLTAGALAYVQVSKEVKAWDSDNDPQGRKVVESTGWIRPLRSISYIEFVDQSPNHHEIASVQVAHHWVVHFSDGGSIEFPIAYGPDGVDEDRDAVLDGFVAEIRLAWTKQLSSPSAA
ncbi:hypothetical protein GS580_16780 [Rhodococcus hoagii]|nr:hypothetical protein [Prescottella equi]